MREEKTKKSHPDLSEREEQILRLAMQGFTDTAIANKLGISEATVGTYWGRVRIKLGPFSRTELVARALQEENEVLLNSLRTENQRLLSQLQDLDLDSIDENSINLAKQLIENAPDAMIVVNERGIIELINESALALFAYERDELLGERISKLIPDRFRVVHDSHRAEYVSNPEKRKMGEHLATPGLRKDGSEVTIAASLSAIQSKNGLVVTCILREAVAAELDGESE